MKINQEALVAAIQTANNCSTNGDPWAECSLCMGEMEDLVEDVITTYLEFVEKENVTPPGYF